MILAAGLGTRLRPLTNDRPKALVKVGGHTMLEITLRRLRAIGIQDVIINTYHFAEQVRAYLDAHQSFGMCVEVSREDLLLDTGGGLRNVAWFFLGRGGRTEPFLVHNVDVISNIDVLRMIRFHRERDALATLAVQDRPTSRPLLFDQDERFRGRAEADGQADDPALHALAFSGVHVISPRIFAKMIEEGAFSIISSYARLALEGETIVGFRADEYYWRDLGRPEQVERAAQDLAEGIVSID